MHERVQRYQEAMVSLDAETLAELRHPEYKCYYPQSGECFVGHENWAGAHSDYESHFGAEHLTDIKHKGGEQRAQVTSLPTIMPFGSSPIVNVSDTGDLVVLEGKGLWPDGKHYNWVLILEYRDGLVWRETQYFAEPFEAPAWRAEFTEPIED